MLLNYRTEDGEKGPVTADVVQDAIRSGEVLEDVLVRREGDNQWVPFNRLFDSENEEGRSGADVSTSGEPNEQDKKIGCGCLVVLLIAGLVLFEIFGGPASGEDAEINGPLAQELAGPSNALVQKLRSMNLVNAYAIGHADGSVESAVARARSGNSGVADLAKLKNQQFELILQLSEGNGVSTQVLMRYRDGWNDGCSLAAR